MPCLFFVHKCIFSWGAKQNLGQPYRISNWIQTPRSNLTFPFTVVKGHALHVGLKLYMGLVHDTLYRNCKQADYTNAYFPSPNTQSALFSGTFHWTAYISVWKLSKKYYTRLLCIERHFQSGSFTLKHFKLASDNHH